MIEKKKVKSISRRNFIKTTAAGVVGIGLGANIFIPRVASAGRKKLKILRWAHWAPSFNEWFEKTWIKEWGEKNNTEVIVDNLATGFPEMAVTEAEKKEGHDLFEHNMPDGAFEKHVIDHREIFEACEKRYGKPIPMAVKWNYNPKTNNYHGFCVGYTPHLVNYRKDLWDEVGIYPNTWEDVRIGGSKIKKKFNIPVGIGISGITDSPQSLQSIMYSYGSSVQDEKGNVVLNSKQTIEAVKFVRALFKEAMTPDVLRWDDSSNNRLMLRGKGSLTLNPISITRWAENKRITDDKWAEISKKIWLALPPEGPEGRIAEASRTSLYLIWKFSKNIEGAKQFLVDYVGHSRDAFLTSEFYEVPTYPDTVPDLKERITNDPKADPPDKYKVLRNTQSWTVSTGYPGFANAATQEIYISGIISQMFSKAVTDKLSSEEAIKEAEAKCKEIFIVWKKKGLV